MNNKRTMNQGILDANNNFGISRKDIRTAIVKVPHLSKKLHIKFCESDMVHNLKENIKTLIKNEDYNFGIFLTNHKRNIKKFPMDNVRLVDIINGENKLIYKKKDRIFKFDIPNIKRLKAINTEANKERFIELILNSDLHGLIKLLENGFDPNYIFNEESALHYAVIADNSVALITLLVSQGAHLDYRSLKNQSVLHKAVELSKHDAVKIILEFGLDPNVQDYKGLTPIYFSVLYNTDTICFEKLLKYGADTNCVDCCGMTLLDQACFNNKLEHLKLLVSRCDNINTSSNNSGNSPLHLAVMGKALDCITFLLDHGAQRDLKNNENMTALDIAESHFPDAKKMFNTDEKLKEEIKEEIKHFLQREHENKNNERIIGKGIYSSESLSSKHVNEEIKEFRSEKKGSEPKLLRKYSTVSTSSLVAGSIFSVSDDVEKKDYFGLPTKVVEFKRMFENGFGFSLETEITDEKATQLFVPSYQKPSIHRICKWNVLSTMMTLFIKPYLLEVNNIYVGNMPYNDLVILISSMKEKVILKIANNINSKPTTDNDVADITSRISSIGQLNELTSFEHNIVGVVDDSIKNAEAAPSFQSIENISALQMKSVEEPPFFNPLSGDNYEYLPENDYKVNDTFTQSLPPEPESVMPKSRLWSKEEPLVPSTPDRDIVSPNLYSEIKSFNTKLIPPKRILNTSVQISNINPNSSKSSQSKTIFTDLYTSDFTQFKLPQYGLHRTGIVLNLNKTKNCQNQIHIPLKIN